MEANLTLFSQKNVEILALTAFFNNFEAIADICAFLKIPFSKKLVLHDSLSASVDMDYGLPPVIKADQYAFYTTDNKAFSNLIEGLDIFSRQK